MTKNQLQYWANQETIRTNLQNEAIKRRSNELGAEENQIKRDTQQESARHNLVTEEVDKGHLKIAQVKAMNEVRDSLRRGFQEDIGLTGARSILTHWSNAGHK